MAIRKSQLWLFLFLIILVVPGRSQKSIPDDFCLSQQEQSLFERINELRQSYGKSDLQLSASLSFVAKTHVNDLITNHPDTSICNLSSWSNKGSWTGCCYNPYVPNPDCMWDKPKELTPYPYRGYEFVTYFDDMADPDSVIALLADTREVLDMILARDSYDNKKWICCGVGMNNHYVSVWFGQRKDALRPPAICGGKENIVVVQSEQKAPAAGGYYLIFGSYNNQTDAREALRIIKKADFTGAGIITKNGQSRVYLNKYNTLKEAMYAKQQLAPEYREAWILKE